MTIYPPLGLNSPKDIINFMKHNIITTIIFAVLIVGAYYFCSTLFISQQKSFDKAKINDLEMNASAVSVITAHFMNDIIACVEHSAQALSKYAATPANSELETIYNSISILDLPIESLGFIDLDGTLKTIYPSAFSEAIGRSFDNYEFFKKSEKNGRLTASKVVSYKYSDNQLNDRPFFVLITPVLNNDGVRFGYVTASIGTKGLTDLIQLQKYVSSESHIKFYIVNPDYDQILCSPDSMQGKISDEGRENARNYIIATSKTDIKNSSILIDKGSKKLFLTTSKVNLKDISLMVVASEPYMKTFNYSADASRRILLIIVFTFIILVLIIMLIIYQKVVVKKLKKQITKLEIIIDKNSTKEEIGKISESDYFKGLNEKVNKIKDK